MPGSTASSTAPGLSQDLIDTMTGRHVALVPTVKQLENFPDYADAGEERFPTYAAHMRDLFKRRRETIMAAYDAGVHCMPAPTPGECCRTD